MVLKFITAKRFSRTLKITLESTEKNQFIFTAGNHFRVNDLADCASEFRLFVRFALLDPNLKFDRLQNRWIFLLTKLAITRGWNSKRSTF